MQTYRTNSDREIAQALDQATVQDGRIVFPASVNLERGATWTYLTTDQPFGSFEERVMRGVRRTIRKALGHA